jgi:NAD(P)-dependent dehydrogenase (short-subunit alcohol dehydrogenase family)
MTVFSSPGPRVALITGAARRLGRSLALGFAARGWDIGVHYGQSRSEAEGLAREIAAMGRRAVPLHADLADEDSVARLLPALADRLGVPRCVVNNASAFEEDTAQDFGYTLLARLMAINVAAPVRLARALYEALPEAACSDERQRGVVINLLDQKLYNQNPDFLSYTLSKAALQTATVTLAQALAPKVRVVGLAPGLTLPSGDLTEKEFRAVHGATPLARGSRPEDIAGAACYLADAQAITGTTLLVDGGQHLVPSERDVMFALRH